MSSCSTLLPSLTPVERVLLAHSHTTALIALLDSDHRVVSTNFAWDRTLGNPAATCVGHDVLTRVHPDDVATVAAQFRQAHTDAPIHATVRLRHQDGTWRTCATDVHRAQGDTAPAFVLTAYDMTARMAAQAALHQRDALFRIMVESAKDYAIFATDRHGSIVQWNVGAERLFGYTETEVVGQPAAIIFTPEDRAAGVDQHELQQALREGRGEDERWHLRKDGSRFWASGMVTPLRDADGHLQGFVKVARDYTAHKHTEEQLQHVAAHDMLTGLPNRAAVLDHVRRALARHARHPAYGFAVLFLDLDRFKIINDSLGHHIGDQLLITVAARLQACVRPEDVVARLGGDEFVVLLDSIAGVEDAVAVAERIHAALAQPVPLDTHTISTATSIGITLGTVAYTSPEEVLRDADTAMYGAKRQGAGHYAVFNASMHARAVARLQVETDLQQALIRDELVLHYQPIVDLATGQITGMEALVRWQHPTRGLIPPAVFIPIAEEIGVITRIGQWVLATACAQMQQWHQAVPTSYPWTLHVNVSGVQFQHADLATQVATTLAATGLPPAWLQLEITESVLLAENGSALALVQALVGLGVSVTLDDFGTGYSSLSYVHRFPVGTLKIDRSFIATLDTGGEHRELVRTIILLAHNLGLRVVAEGIETAAQRDQLVALGCAYGQGYFFGRPMDAATARAVLASDR